MISLNKTHRNCGITVNDCSVDSPENEAVRLYVISDTHIGDELTDIKALKSWISWIANDDCAAVILNGDLMDTGIEGSPTGPYHQVLPVGEQIAATADLFAPISDKICSVNPGNHELRVDNKCGIDTTLMLATRLGVENFYQRNGGLVYLRFGNRDGRKKPNRYNIFTTHSRGGGKKAGGKITKAEECAGIVSADLSVIGHVHGATSSSKRIFVPTNGAPSAVEQVFASQAAWQSYGGYGADAMMPPTSIHQVVFSLAPNTKAITVISHCDPKDPEKSIRL